MVACGDLKIAVGNDDERAATLRMDVVDIERGERGGMRILMRRADDRGVRGIMGVDGLGNGSGWMVIRDTVGGTE